MAEKIVKDISFIKTRVELGFNAPVLTPEYCYLVGLLGKKIQINIDLNVIIKMEKLSNKATLDDLKKSGLYPLYLIIQQPNVRMSCSGVHETPEFLIGQAHEAYERFCDKFWPTSQNDINASYRKIPDNPKNKSHLFFELGNKDRYMLGSSYLAMLHIQNILHIPIKNQTGDEISETPEQKFERFIYGMIDMIDHLDGPTVFVAKMAFWKPLQNDFSSLSKELIELRKAIINNLTKKPKNKSTIAFCLNASWDINWIKTGALTELFKENGLLENLEDNIELWFGTFDEKLVTISRHINYVTNNDNGYNSLQITDFPEFKKFNYWKNVYNTSMTLREFRKSKIHETLNEDIFLKRIDHHVGQLEKNLLSI